MNTAAFQQAQQAYERRDYVNALEFYNTVLIDQNFPLQQGEVGIVYHQIGNCFVKLQSYGDAISAYMNATKDESYISIGTVYYNLGMAYAYMSDFGNAIANFQIAIDTPNYRSKHKAYTAMGNALMKSGKSADAAAAFRNAAMDNTNPDPTRALLNLGVCFMALNRPEDAITVYNNAFQYNLAPDFRNRLNANLGQAFVAAGQMSNAVKAFEESLRDLTYQLSDSASVDYQRAIASVSKGQNDVEPMIYNDVASSSFMQPDPQQAFADDVTPEPYESTPISEYSPEDKAEFDKWTESAKEAAYKPKAKKQPWKIVLVVFLFVLAGCIIAGSIFFCLGYGIPSQEMVAKDYFSNPIEAKDKDFAKTVSDDQKDSFVTMINQDANAKVTAVQRSVNESSVYVTSKTDKGMDVNYKLKMTRDFIG